MRKIVTAVALLFFLFTYTRGMCAPLLWFNPVSSNIKVGETVVVQLMASDAGDLYGADLEIGFDPVILDVMDADGGPPGTQILPGDCPSPDFVTTNQVDTNSGTIVYVATTLSPGVPCSGGIVASITFKGLTEGKSNLYFPFSLLVDPDGQPIPHSNQNAEINVVSEGDGDELLFTVPAIIAGGAKFAGTYSGTMRFTVSGPGGTASDSDIIVIVLNRNRTIVVNPGTPFEGSGTLKGDTATVDYPAQNFSVPGFSCVGTIRGVGTLNGETINGTLGPDVFSCNGVPLRIVGTFTTTKQD